MKIIDNEETLKVIMSTVDKLVELVKPTYGPSGNKVIIGKGYGASILDDGVQIAKDLELEDEAENYVLKLIREVAVKTNDRVGDGTTSSLILLQAILKEADKSKFYPREIVDELKEGLAETIKQIRGQSRVISTIEDLEKVARISFDNEEVAKLLAKIIFDIGADGLIDVRASQGTEIESEVVKGFKLESGYISPYMANEGEKCVIEDAVIITTEKAFYNNAELVPIMEMVVKAGKSNLVLFCKELSGEALTTAILNKMKGSFRLLAVKATDSELDEVSLITGARHILADTKVTEEDFGSAKKVVSKIDETVIIDGNGSKEEINEAVDELKKSGGNEKKIANLTNSVAIIKVGAKTESEAKALQFKVEDASNAVKVAFKGGVVMGAGFTLARVKTSSDILNEAFKYPVRQLIDNMGEFVMNENIIDPTEVVIAGVESAVSIASLLITTTGIIYQTNDKKL